MSGKPSIPAWQRATTETPSSSSEAEAQPEPADQSEQTTSPITEAPTPTEDDLDQPDSTDLLEQASRFLEDPTIRDAPRERKVAFLESKGVNAEDIEALLGEPTPAADSGILEEAGERAWATVSKS